MSSPVRIILVTKTGCPHCTDFLAGPWPDLQDRLSYGIGGGPVDEIDMADREAAAKLPQPIRKVLQFVPQIYALYSDGTIESPKNPITSDAGLAELEQWTQKGPPRYSKTPVKVASQIVDDEDSLVNPTIEVIAVTSTDCPWCSMWETSGELKKFLNSMPPGVESSHFNVNPAQPPSSPEDARRRMSLAGIKVPSVIAVDHSKWKQPVTRGLESRDVMLSPGDPRTPPGLELFNRWLDYMRDRSKPFRGYMILATEASCGHCRAWKESGGMAQFIETNHDIPGVLFVHNGRLPAGVRIGSYPSLWFVPALAWSSQQPEAQQGPDPRDTPGVAKWVKQLTKLDGNWDNDPNYIPPEMSGAMALYQPRTKPPLAPKRRPIVRQSLR